MKRLATNPIYMCNVISNDLRLFAVMGYITFKPKYIESEYKKSASAANLFSGKSLSCSMNSSMTIMVKIRFNNISFEQVL